MARKSSKDDSFGKLMGSGDSSRRRRAPATGGRGPSGPSGPVMQGPSGPSGPSGPMMNRRTRKRKGPGGGSDELMRRLYG